MASTFSNLGGLIGSRECPKCAVNGILFVALFALATMYVADLPLVKSLNLSPLIVGIILGMVWGNTLKSGNPEAWTGGIVFSAKGLLRLAIILYGFRITVQDMYQIGWGGAAVAFTMLLSTFLLGSFLGRRLFGVDRETAILTSSGSAVCGAAAVLSTETVLKSASYKAILAVGTVVLFGTLAMFALPTLYKAGYIDLSEAQFGIYVGAVIHEVAQVVAIGDVLGEEVSNNAVIVKMARVIMLPLLLIAIGIYMSRLQNKTGQSDKTGISIPWFALWFLVMTGINSLGIIPARIVAAIIEFDTFLLTMAMAALGMETTLAKIKQAGMRPIYLATFLFVWLMIGGYFITKLIVV